MCPVVSHVKAPVTRVWAAVMRVMIEETRKDVDREERS